MYASYRAAQDKVKLFLYKGRPAFRKSFSTSSTRPPSHPLATLAGAEAVGQRELAATLALADDQQQVTDWRQNTQGDDGWLHGPRPDSWWTGPKPQAAGSLPFPNLKTASRAELKQYFDNTWSMTEMLFAGLKGEEPYYRPPYHDLRHPLIFYYGHTAAFYINKFRLAGLLDQPIEPYFEAIFETGVDEMRWDDLSKNHMDWPAIRDVHRYRAEAYNKVVDVIENGPDFESLAAGLQDSPWWSVPMGFEHERIHLETSSVLMRELPLELVQEPEGWAKLQLSCTEAGWQPPARGENFPAVNRMIEVPAGEVTMGKAANEPTYGWDNEYGSKPMKVGRFSASEFQVTNGEFYEFVTDGGYRDQSLWSDNGWGWACFRNVRAPTFWRTTGPNGLNQFNLRTVFSEQPMQWDWPAVVNYHEAKAYCAWKTRKDGSKDAPYRVLTEAEHWQLRDLEPSDDPIMQPSTGNNYNLVAGAERAVTAAEPNGKGFADVFGNAWDWCEDHQNAFPGFELHKLYDDFTLPCFDGEHNMIMGGSFISTGDQASVFARYQFRPHFFQHAGFRVVQPHEQPWLVTACMDSPGPYASAQAPYRQAADYVEPPNYLASDGSVKQAGSAVPASMATEKVRQTQADYEQEEWANRYLHLHFPPEAVPEWVPAEAVNFPARCGQTLIETAIKLKAPRRNALDLGCGVGGASFALADQKEGYSEVTGVEYSHGFVDTAQQLQQHGKLSYSIQAEGDAREEFTAVVPASVVRDRLSFVQGDATNPSSQEWGQQQYDAVLLGNLLCRLSKPKTVLQNMKQLVTPGGMLMITSPFSWKPEFTERSEWLGGQDGGASCTEAVANVLDEAGFEAIDRWVMPLTIRHHSRFYELIGAQGMIFRHKK